ncbi:hypothetical protein KEN51_CDS0338 [Pseudomonas phage vB_Pae10145-KEN51]
MWRGACLYFFYLVNGLFNSFNWLLLLTASL